MAVTRRIRNKKTKRSGKTKRSKKTRRHMKKMRGGDKEEDITNAKAWLQHIELGYGHEEAAPDFNPYEFIEKYRAKTTPNIRMNIDTTVKKEGIDIAIKHILESLTRRKPPTPYTPGKRLSRASAVKNSNYIGPSATAHRSAHKTPRTVRIDEGKNVVFDISPRAKSRHAKSSH